MRDTASGLSRGGSKLAVVLGLAALTLGSALTTATPVLATSVAVYVSYADSLRANPVNFPTPWAGSPNTLFEGCQPAAACVYDAGAIRIVNNSSSAETVDAIAVHLSTCTYTGWPSQVLAPGAELIVTQLASGAATGGCTGPVPTQFDTSDIGDKGANNVGNCVQNNVVPIVDVTVNSTKTSYGDTAQVLNTGGVDAGVCSGNESTQWRLIGVPGACQGSVLMLAPPSQSHPVLSTATVTATFTNGCNQPLSNTTVDFAVSAGPNSGITGSAVTDANGQASFSYSSSKVGTDTLRASVTNLAGSIPSNPVAATWTVSFAPGGGAFVISDLKDGAGTVYWWGAQWWKQDHLSTGLAPASFKGYENGNLSPWCGQTWTTRPGNSSKPPKAVGSNSYMAVIVASWVTKRGAVISGNIVHIVLVRTNVGYGPNPGHPGTGTIVATLC